MQKIWRHWFGILLAIGVLLVIVDGAVIGPGTQPASPLLSIHRIAAAGLGALILGLAVWLFVTDSRPEARRLAWITLAITVFEIAAGLAPVESMAPHAAGIAHALLAAGPLRVPRCDRGGNVGTLEPRTRVRQ